MADPDDAPRQVARRLLRTAWKATLATLDTTSGHPYASLVAVAAEADGSPVLLLSSLALHARNLEADQRASLLLDGTGPGREALTGPRVTLIGRIRPATGGEARRRYLARHPAAHGFADFTDFAFYALEVERAHLVAGFGRIAPLARSDVLLDLSGAATLVAAEEDVVAHMNADHADAIDLMAHHLADAKGSGWRMLGCDPEGIDLARDDRALRLLFPNAIGTPDEARRALVALVAAARKKSGSESAH